jgi:hypothetical protein
MCWIQSRNDCIPIVSEVTTVKYVHMNGRHILGNCFYFKNMVLHFMGTSRIQWPECRKHTVCCVRNRFLLQLIYYKCRLIFSEDAIHQQSICFVHTLLHMKSCLKDILKFVLFVDFLYRVKIKNMHWRNYSTHYCAIPVASHIDP